MKKFAAMAAVLLFCLVTAVGMPKVINYVYAQNTSEKIHYSSEERQQLFAQEMQAGYTTAEILTAWSTGMNMVLTEEDMTGNEEAAAGNEAALEEQDETTPDSIATLSVLTLDGEESFSASYPGALEAIRNSLQKHFQSGMPYQMAEVVYRGNLAYIEYKFLHCEGEQTVNTVLWQMQFNGDNGVIVNLIVNPEDYGILGGAMYVEAADVNDSIEFDSWNSTQTLANNFGAKEYTSILNTRVSSFEDLISLMESGDVMLQVGNLIYSDGTRVPFANMFFLQDLGYIEFYGVMCTHQEINTEISAQYSRTYTQ